MTRHTALVHSRATPCVGRSLRITDPSAELAPMPADAERRMAAELSAACAFVTTGAASTVSLGVAPDARTGRTLALAERIARQHGLTVDFRRAGAELRIHLRRASGDEVERD